MSWRHFLIVGIGGFFGAAARYAVALWIGRRWGQSFPVGTFVVNVSGSFLFGLLMALSLERLMASIEWRLFLTVGFLGAYTTFSTFEYETGALLTDDRWLFAALNVAGSVVAGFVALKAGELMARAL